MLAEKMRGVVVSPRKLHYGIVLTTALLQSVLLLSSCVVPTIHRASFKSNEKMELQRSTEQYREYFYHPPDSRRELQQVDSPREEAENAAEEEMREQPSFFPTEPYHLGVSITNWDGQRADWLGRNPHMKTTEDSKPGVLIVTGSQPEPCQSPVGDHFNVKAFKNKIDYARLHNYQIFNNIVFLDPLLKGVWAKLPIVRTLMLTHPEIEWFIWIDSDALFTDMVFEIPFHTYDKYNLVMWAWQDGFKKRDWVAVNTGVFFLRNCQWSFDLFDKWSPMGPEGIVRNEAGKVLSSFLTNRVDFFPADDQSALVYLMLTDEEVMDKIKLVENDYLIHGYWVDIVNRLEEIMEKYHPGLGDCRWPFTTHFTGCSPCNGNNNPNYPYEMCMEHFNRAFNFADTQVLAYMGYQHESLASSEVVSIWNETTRPLELLGVNPWRERIAQVAASASIGC